MPLNPLQYLTKFGNQQGGAENMADWGNPQLHGSYAEDGESYRMPIPKWQPGEFEEWKQAHVTGMPTQYGANAQRNYKAGRIGASFGQGELVNPALMALMKGIR